MLSPRGSARGLGALPLGLCLLLAALLLPAPVWAQDPMPPAEAEAERAEAERAEAERAEAEQAEAEHREAQRTAQLTASLEAATAELAAADASLRRAVDRRNRAAGDLVVVRVDLADAQERVTDSRRRAQRAARTQERATADLEEATANLGSAAAAAYRAGGRSHTPHLTAMEAVVRSRDSQEFVDGLTYLRAMRPRWVEQRLLAEQAQEQAADELRASEQALRRAEDDVADAEDALPAAEAEVSRQEGQLAAALAQHAAGTDRVIRDAHAQRAATQGAPHTSSTDRNVALTAELVTLARASETVAERLRAAAARIEAGTAGVEPWQEFRCPVDGPTRFVNDWGFPRSGLRSHEGTDVFASRGTPVVAMADAVVRRVSRLDVGLGGRAVSYEVDGYRVYNAHLDTVEDLEVGDELAAGQVIGTVGSTGNARTTPPHNHVGIYRPDGAPVNPYPLLRRACR